MGKTPLKSIVVSRMWNLCFISALLLHCKTVILACGVNRWKAMFWGKKWTGASTTGTILYSHPGHYVPLLPGKWKRSFSPLCFLFLSSLHPHICFLHLECTSSTPFISARYHPSPSCLKTVWHHLVFMPQMNSSDGLFTVCWLADNILNKARGRPGL